jgi:hypothetical protein
MVKVKLQYRGKKPTFTLGNPQLTAPVKVTQEPFWVPEPDAEWLLRTNPKMFFKLDSGEEVVEEVEEEKKEVLVCEKCGKEYLPMHRQWYEKHIESCEG